MNPIDPVTVVQNGQTTITQLAMGLLVILGIAFIIYEARHRNPWAILGAVAVIVIAGLFVIFPNLPLDLAAGIGNRLHLGG